MKIFFLKNNKKKFKSEKGFSLVEIIVAAGIISTSLVAIVGISAQSMSFSRQALDTYKASTLLEEGAEAVRTVRDNTLWSTFSGLSSSTTNYYPSFCNSSNTWSLIDVSISPSSDCTGETIDNFTRTITINSVSRNSSTDDITTSSGVDDLNTKLVTVTVSWIENSTTFTKTISLYVMNIFS